MSGQAASAASADPDYTRTRRARVQIAELHPAELGELMQRRPTTLNMAHTMNINNLAVLVTG
jgi:hypothetical protein